MSASASPADVNAAKADRGVVKSAVEGEAKVVSGPLHDRSCQ